MLATYRRQGASAPRHSGEPADEQTTHTVLPSSTELFYFYRQTLEQCARLSTRAPFLDLCGVFKKWLKAYAEDVLRQALVRCVLHLQPGVLPVCCDRRGVYQLLHSDRTEPARRSIDTRPNVVEMQRWCMVLNTADYCATTAVQLEDKLREKIDGEFKDRVTLEAEREIFLG